MKGLPLFFLKNSMGANMKKSFRNPCNGQASTSTLPTFSIDNVVDNPPRKSVTLEEMILQLEVEEELARRATFQDDDHGNNNNNTMIHHRRKSCVSNSDILRSARSALSQYPRFSLDGKDAMYRSSFRKIDGKEGLLGAPLLQCRRVAARRRSGTNASTSALGGESAVVWCKPGVVAKLMGLEAMPVPVARRKHHHSHNTGKMGCKEEGGCNRNPRRRERRKEASSLEAAREGKAPWQPTHAFI